MRKLQILVAAGRGALPALVVATLLPAAACSTDVTPGASTTGATGAGGAGQGGSGGFVQSSSSSGAGGEGGAALCGPGENLTAFVVDVPPEGVPAEPGQICAIMMQPVESNRAARVTLTRYSPAPYLAMGLVTVEPALSATVIGTPTIAVIDAGTPSLLGMMVTNIQPTAGGFSFHAEWPQPFQFHASPWARLTVKTTLEIQCEPPALGTRIVESITYVNLCEELDGVTWVSSGDECKVCSIIAEMAPSPIVPDKSPDDLPLGRVLRLRLVALARVGRKVVILAENDGGGGLSYAWQPSGGDVERLADDVVVWTPPDGPGPHLIQAAVQGDDVAGVASYAWQEAA